MIMGRTIPFDKEDICDECGKKGAFDFMGDYLCSDCSNKVFASKYENIVDLCSEENIIEGNILIAEFKGDISETDFYDGRGYVKTFVNFNGSPFEFDELEFHSSWDWLIPVVEHIEKLGWLVTIRGASCYIDIEEDETGEFGATQRSKKLSVWLAVVEFVKWYNKQDHSLPF
jgi:hypothetical protein